MDLALKKYFNFEPIFFLKSSLIFALLTCIGTLSHEYGHIVFAKLLGYDTILHFDSMSWYINGIDGEKNASIKDSVIVTIGGILQTILTGSLGFFLVFQKSKKLFWLGVYLSFFWSREVINLLSQVLNAIIKETEVFIGNGDEVILSNLLNLPSGFFSILLGLMGSLICIYIVLIKIPNHLKLSFILSGFLGSVLGFYLWFLNLGPILLP